MTMRDVLGGLEEIATMLSYNPWPGDFEIIAIHPDDEDSQAPREEIVVKCVPPVAAEVISYNDAKAQQLKSA